MAVNYRETQPKSRLIPSAKTFPLPVRVLNAVGSATHAKRLKRFRLEETALSQRTTSTEDAYESVPKT